MLLHFGFPLLEMDKFGSDDMVEKKEKMVIQLFCYRELLTKEEVLQIVI